MERAGFIRLLKEDFRSGPQMWTVWFCVPQEKNSFSYQSFGSCDCRLKLNEGDCSTVTTKFLPPFFNFFNKEHRAQEEMETLAFATVTVRPPAP